MEKFQVLTESNTYEFDSLSKASRKGYELSKKGISYEIYSFNYFWKKIFTYKPNN